MKKVKRRFIVLKNIFADKDIQYLNEADYKTSNFYEIFKVHKFWLVTNAIKEHNSEVVNINKPQGQKVRPIVRGLKCSNRELSKLTDTFLKHIKSHIRAK